MRRSRRKTKNALVSVSVSDNLVWANRYLLDAYLSLKSFDNMILIVILWNIRNESFIAQSRRTSS